MQEAIYWQKKKQAHHNKRGGTSSPPPGHSPIPSGKSCRVKGRRRSSNPDSLLLQQSIVSVSSFGFRHWSGYGGSVNVSVLGCEQFLSSRSSRSQLIRHSLKLLAVTNLCCGLWSKDLADRNWSGLTLEWSWW